MVWLQKYFLENVTFLPLKKSLPDDQNRLLFSSVLQGHYVTIPGYENPKQFLSDLSKDFVTDLILKRELEITNSMTASIQRYFNQVKVTPEEALNLKNLTDLGITIPIHFQVSKRLGYAFLVTKVTRVNETWVLDGYDPNFGFGQSIVKVDKNGELVTLNYGRTKEVFYLDSMMETHHPQLKLKI